MTNRDSTSPNINRFVSNAWNSTATEEDIFYCFRLLLGRNPSADEWQWHLCKRGSNLTSTVRSYLGSLEFTKRKMLGQDATLNDLRTASVNGAQLYVHANDPVIGRCVLANAYEPEVVRAFCSQLRAGMNVVDVGANVGFYTMLSATLVGDSGRVFAIEPNMANVRLLEASRRLNGFDNVTVAPVAAANHIGILALHAGESNGTTTALEDVNEVLAATELVPCINVDSLLSKSERVDFIKIDVEGAEPLALQGMCNLIARCRPMIISEFSPESLPTFSKYTGEEYLSLLIGMNYSIGIVEPERVIDYGTDIIAIMNAFKGRHTDHIDILCQPR